MKKLNIGWGPVSRCNMRCQFCYSAENRARSGELAYKDWVTFIDDNHEYVNSINYGTGENTLDPAWFRLISHIREKWPHIRQALTTNGHLSEAVINPAFLESFIASIDEVDVSLDFCDKEKPIAFRGQPRAWDWALSTLALCRQYNKSATIVFIGSSQNIAPENLDGLFEIAADYGAILRMNIYRPTGGINRESERFILSHEALVAALEHICKQHRLLALNDQFFSPLLLGRESADPSGNASVRILANGAITPSTYLLAEKWHIANIRDPKALAKIACKSSVWENPALPEECGPCVYASQCRGGVLDRRILWYGSLDKRDPYCQGPYKTRKEKLFDSSTVSFESVHDGYLPTIFFIPGK